MKNSKKAESLAWIIIWVFILSLTLVWIANIVTFSQQSLYEISEKKNLQWLNSTANTLVEKLDTQYINVGENFYMYKNTSTNNYDVFTGATNQSYQYINNNWEYVDDISSYSGAVYSRIFTLSSRSTLQSGDIDIVDFTIKPVLNR